MRGFRCVVMIGVFLPFFTFSQEEDNDVQHDVCIVEPEFPGGQDSLTAFIRVNVEYPAEAIESKEEGVVYISFVVNKDGSIQDIYVRKGLSDVLNEEAMRVVSIMPNWSPGRHHGKLVRHKYTIPVLFRLVN